MNDRTYLTADEAAAYLGFKKTHLYNKCARKEIPYYKPSGGKRGKTYFLRSELDKWIASGRVATNAEIQQRANNFPTH